MSLASVLCLTSGCWQTRPTDRISRRGLFVSRRPQRIPPSGKKRANSLPEQHPHRRRRRYRRRTAHLGPSKSKAASRLVDGGLENKRAPGQLDRSADGRHDVGSSLRSALVEPRSGSGRVGARAGRARDRDEAEFIGEMGPPASSGRPRARCRWRGERLSSHLLLAAHLLALSAALGLGATLGETAAGRQEALGPPFECWRAGDKTTMVAAAGASALARGKLQDDNDDDEGNDDEQKPFREGKRRRGSPATGHLAPGGQPVLAQQQPPATTFCRRPLPTDCRRLSGSV